jgi:hypothetical protein
MELKARVILKRCIEIGFRIGWWNGLFVGWFDERPAVNIELELSYLWPTTPPGL